MKFGQLFKKVRKQSRMTQMEFCKILGMSQSWLSKIEADKLEPLASVYIIVKEIEASLQENKRSA